MKILRLLLASVIVSALGIEMFAAVSEDADTTGEHRVELTWMSIASWYFKIGDLRIILDGYITRIPGPPFFFSHPATQATCMD